ncbi:unnamed protein product [Cuscuta campestris]|uniref:Peptidase S8/S53 domain-containing protein n=1 Tax=Cuscuta campestris TaxID=132261 RepID=A0A484MF20_9ASTE|nr:unnamed protein product [Cuscuta campestris]
MAQNPNETENPNETVNPNETEKVVSQSVYEDHEVVIVEQSMFRSQEFMNDKGALMSTEREDESSVDNFRPVIAIVDTGVNPNHECFKDNHIPPIHDDRWSGGTISVPYKRKILALRNYYADKPRTSAVEDACLHDVNFPEDLKGHGTACASIAAAASTGVELLERVFAPRTLIKGLRTFFDDPLNYGSYLAFKNNILVCKSAGNDGPWMLSLTGGLAPWTMVVGACGSGGHFITNVELGSSVTLEGFNAFLDKDWDYSELVHQTECYKEKLKIEPKEKGKKSREEAPEPKQEINYETVKGKILVWEHGKCPRKKILDAQARGILRVGVLKNEFSSHNLQESIVYVTMEDGKKIYDYIAQSRASKKKPTARLLRSIYKEKEDTNILCLKSSRGPNMLDEYICKPDICAPVENIFCATRWNEVNMNGGYRMLSGTSMSNAMVAGMISRIKSIKKDWGPGRIRSAIITTATPMNKSFLSMGCGSGRINPTRALDPGLVYDVSWDEFRRYLLGRPADMRFLAEIGENTNGEVIPSNALNLPSFSLAGKERTSEIFRRTLTNVGPKPICSYRAQLHLKIEGNDSSCLQMNVKPKKLNFKSIGDKKKFELFISSEDGLPPGVVAYGRLIWIEEESDDPHHVLSPIIMWHPGALCSDEEDSSSSSQSPMIQPSKDEMGPRPKRIAPDVQDPTMDGPIQTELELKWIDEKEDDAARGDFLKLWQSITGLGNISRFERSDAFHWQTTLHCQSALCIETCTNDSKEYINFPILIKLWT